MASERKWTDLDLADAVAQSGSWKHVCLALGISVGGKTFTSLRDRSDFLGLDTSHLYAGGSRKDILGSIADEALREAVYKSRSWNDLYMRLGYVSFLRGAAADRLNDRLVSMGVSTRHFGGLGNNGFKPLEDSSPHPFRNEPDPSCLRRSAIGDAISWFGERGYPVSLPVEPTAYDLVADVDGTLYRIQVKSSTASDRGVNFARSAYDRSRGRATTTPYRAGDIDYFFVVLADGSIYLIPYEAIGERISANIGRRYEAFRVGGA